MVLFFQPGSIVQYASAENADHKQETEVIEKRSGQQTMLRGGVHHTDFGDSEQNHPEKSGAGNNKHAGSEMKPSISPTDRSPESLLDGEAAYKSRMPIVPAGSHYKMTVEDYRKLQYGIVGLRISKSDKYFTVAEVLPGCPAALAGIRPGDVEIEANDHVFSSSDGEREKWNIVDGKAGTPVDLTVLRHGSFMTFHLIRLNIEDIPNASIRHSFERMLSKFGPPANE